MRDIKEDLIEEYNEVKNRKRVDNFKVDKDDQLFKTSKDEDDIFVSRNTPFVKRQLHDIESNQVYYTLYFKTKNRYAQVEVKASTIATRRELLMLADEGLSVNDNNVKDLIRFIDAYIREHNIPMEQMTTRIGYVGDKFIHPQDDDIKIVQTGGYQSLINAFKSKGTLEQYSKNVFQLVRNEHTALFFIFATLASPLLKPHDLDPFIVDLSGRTSSGKTSMLRLCSSVWGTKDLYGEWNITKVALERKASFLNSFPLLLDDTRKASPFILKDIVYQFSGGKTKARGNIKTIDEELTYNNVLISTGEVAITEYNTDQAGAAARVISIDSKPFSFNDFTALYDNMQKYYGTLGVAFLAEYNSDKKHYDTLFKQLEVQYFNESNGNEVLMRLGRAYAIIHLAGYILNNIPGFEVEVDEVMKRAYQVVSSGENSSYDKPKELLTRLLEELDGKINNVKHNDEEDDERAETLAISRHEGLCIPVAVVNKFLDVEARQTRKLWLEREFIIDHDGADNKQVRYKHSRPKCIVVKREVYQKLGFEFMKY